MKTFDEKAVCPKCGHSEIDTQYCEGYDWIKIGSCCFEIKQQHLHRRCKRCHYGWPEKCLPAAPVPPVAARDEVGEAIPEPEHPNPPYGASAMVKMLWLEPGGVLRITSEMAGPVKFRLELIPKE